MMRLTSGVLFAASLATLAPHADRMIAAHGLATLAPAAAAAAQNPVPATVAGNCARLATLTLADTTITSTEVVAGPAFTPPGGRALGSLPAFCRVAATSRPAVRFEVWLPMNSWNQKFQGVGNGANAGSISYDAMAAALRRGYAVASTDTGHATANARDASWALGRPDLVADFAHRGLHRDDAPGVPARERVPAHEQQLEDEDGEPEAVVVVGPLDAVEPLALELGRSEEGHPDPAGVGFSEVGDLE